MDDPYYLSVIGQFKKNSKESIELERANYFFEEYYERCPPICKIQLDNINKKIELLQLQEK